MWQGIAEGLVVHLHGLEVLLDRSRRSEHIGPVRARLVGGEFCRLHHVTTRPHDNRVPLLDGCTLQKRVSDASPEEPDAEARIAFARVAAHAATDAVLEREELRRPIHALDVPTPPSWVRS